MDDVPVRWEIKHAYASHDFPYIPPHDKSDNYNRLLKLTKVTQQSV